MRDTNPTPAQAAAADLAARIVLQATLGPLRGVRCKVDADDHAVRLTVTDLPREAVELLPGGRIGPTARGAQISAQLAGLAALACGQAGLRRRALFQVHPIAIERAAAAQAAATIKRRFL